MHLYEKEELRWKSKAVVVKIIDRLKTPRIRALIRPSDEASHLLYFQALAP